MGGGGGVGEGASGDPRSGRSKRSPVWIGLIFYWHFICHSPLLTRLFAISVIVALKVHLKCLTKCILVN